MEFHELEKKAVSNLRMHISKLPNRLQSIAYIYFFFAGFRLFLLNLRPPVINGMSRMRGDLHVRFLGGFRLKDRRLPN
jgi:hypothetical protein